MVTKIFLNVVKSTCFYVEICLTWFFSILRSVPLNWNQLIDNLLMNLVNSSGTWEKETIQSVERRNVIIQKAKHSKKGYKHRAKLLINKMI